MYAFSGFDNSNAYILTRISQAKKIRALSPKDKKAVGALLDAIEDTLGKHWTKHPGYQRLQDNIGKVRQALNDPDDQHNQNDHGKSRHQIRL